MPQQKIIIGKVKIARICNILLTVDVHTLITRLILAGQPLLIINNIPANMETAET